MKHDNKVVYLLIRCHETLHRPQMYVFPWFIHADI